MTSKAEIDAKRSAKNILTHNKRGNKKIRVIRNLSKLFVLDKNSLKIIFIFNMFIYILLYVNYLKLYLEKLKIQYMNFKK